MTEQEIERRLRNHDLSSEELEWRLWDIAEESVQDKRDRELEDRHDAQPQH